LAQDIDASELESELENKTESLIIDKDVEKFENLDGDAIPSMNFDEAPEIVWKAVLQVLSSYQFEVLNKFYGQIKTRWIDNTLSFQELEPDFPLESSQIRYFVSIKSFVSAEKKVKSHVTIYLQQRYIPLGGEKEEWLSLNLDNILENTLFYRIQRLLLMNKDFIK
jgi:hypothetical protein